MNENMEVKQQSTESTFKKTPKMMEAEQRVGTGEPIEMFLRRMYVLEKKGTPEMGAVLGVSSRTVSNWLRGLGEEIRPWGFSYLWSVQRDRIIESMNENWKDPVKKAQMLAKIHTAESNRLRGIATAKRIADNRPEQLKILKKAQEAIIQAKLKRDKDYLGENPKKMLRKLVEDEGFSNVAVSSVTGMDRGVINRMLKEANLSISPSRFSPDRETLEIRRDWVIGAEKLGFIDRLPRKLPKIVRQLYPVHGRFPSLQEVGKGLGLTRERVRQLDNGAMRVLRRMMEVDRISDLDSTI